MGSKLVTISSYIVDDETFKEKNRTWRDDGLSRLTYLTKIRGQITLSATTWYFFSLQKRKERNMQFFTTIHRSNDSFIYPFIYSFIHLISSISPIIIYRISSQDDLEAQKHAILCAQEELTMNWKINAV